MDTCTTSGRSTQSQSEGILIQFYFDVDGPLRPVYTEHLCLRLTLTPMIDENVFYIQLYRKTQTQPLGVNVTRNWRYTRTIP